MQKIEPKFLITQVPQVATPEFKKTVKKAPKPKVPKAYYDITDGSLVELITAAIRFQLPTFGIHRPQVWKNRDGWGIIYKVLAEVGGAKLKNSHKTNKYDILQLKWKCKKLPLKAGELLIPFKGYEGAVKNIETQATAALHSKLPA